MKILIYGAGVIGCTYGWQLSEAGYDISILVRKGKKELINRNGIPIHCSDFRGGHKQVSNINFRPTVIEELSPQNDYEYIIVTTNSIRLNDILQELSKSAGKATIVFFQNIWSLDEINKYLSTDRYIFGFPFMAGGGREDKYINTIIAETKYSKTLLGEADGRVTPRVQKLADAIGKANMKPFISDQIVTWLIPHGVFIAALSAGIVKAGGTMYALTANRSLVKDTIKAIREGFRICEARGINPKKEKVNKLYYLPLFISVPVVKKVFSDEVMAMMFDGYLKHSTNEISNMLKVIITEGEKHNIKTPHLNSLYKSFNTL